jgi:hypothetical protein
VLDFITNLWKKWPLTIVIRELRGTETRYVFDKGARIKRPDGVHEIELKKRKVRFSAPPFSEYGLTDKGHSIIEVFSPKADVYVPIKHRLTEKGMENLYLADSNVDEWHALETQRLAEFTKPDIPWWQVNFPLIVMMVMGGIFAVILILTFQALPPIIGQIGSVAEKVLEAVIRLETIFGGAITVTPPPAIG